MADITQIKIDNTTYNIKDANAQRTIPSFFSASLIIKTYFNTGSQGKAPANGDTFIIATWGRLSHLNITAQSVSQVVSGNVNSANNYGNHADQELLVLKSGYDYIKPYTTVAWATYNEFHRGYYSSGGRFVWCGSAYWGANYTWAAGTACSMIGTFVNAAAYSA